VLDSDDRFAGSIGRTVSDSTPWWPPDQHPTGPNVVVVLLDDVGFAQLGCYGSSIATPHIDALAGNGIRYTNFHVTALCSPTRACLLTGRNHHQVGVGFLSAFDTGFPSYRGEITPSAATLAEVLRGGGYGTYAAGKWHLTPPPHMTPAGPFHQWPTGRGFDRYYGFLWGEDDQFAPELFHDQHRVDPPKDPGYHLSRDLVDRSERFLSDHLSARPDDPFFLYLAFGACHAPHQAPRDFIDRYEGVFDAGWDIERERVLERQLASGIVPEGTKLSPRNPGVRAWADLDPQEQRLYARMQEVFAGFMTHTDAQIGRLVDFLSRNGILDDTLVLLMSDNGASGEGGEHGTANEYRWFLQLPDPIEDTVAAYDTLGGPSAHNHYPAGWAQVGNTPGKYYKRYAYAGGVRAPLVVHWPGHLDTDSSLRNQFHHVIDVMPTVLDICGIEPPAVYQGVAQLAMHGTSMAYSFTNAGAPSTHEVQYFETAGHRGIYAKGWKAVAAHRAGADFDTDRWELYRIDSDVSECDDLAAREPQLAAELAALWWAEATKYGVPPLDDRMQTRMAALNPAADKPRYVLLAGSRLMNHLAGPKFSNRPFVISADVGRTSTNDEGVLLAWGRQPAGFSFYVQENRLWFDYNLAGDHTLVSADDELPLGSTTLQAIVGGGEGAVTLTLVVGGRTVAEQPLPRLLPAGMGCLSTQCGHNSPSAVSARYEPPFEFSGRLSRVVVDLGPAGVGVASADWHAELASQ
jgi:arylsulfatase A-like enzyme